MTRRITVYTKPSCVQCTAVKRHLGNAGVTFETQDLTAPENADVLTVFKSRGFLSAPVTTCGEFAVPGFNPGALDALVAFYNDDETERSAA